MAIFSPSYCEKKTLKEKLLPRGEKHVSIVKMIQDVLQDSEEALHYGRRRKKIDVVITDISSMPPLMDSIELIRHIREEKENIYTLWY